MHSSYRYLLFGCALAGSWGVGFVMGGGSGGKAGAASTSATGQSDIPRPSTAAFAAGSGHDHSAQQDVGSLRPQPWTRQRLTSAAHSIPREGNLVNMIRRSMELADQLQAEDFPLAATVVRELNKDSTELDIFSAFVVARWAQLDPSAAASFVEIGGQRFIDIEGQAVWGIWGTSDPIAAITQAKGLPDESSRTSAVKTILESMARRDPTSAVAFAQTHMPEMVKNGELSDVLNEGAKAQQGEVAARQLAGVNQAKGLDEATERWARQDRAAALAWARELPDEAVRTEALKGAYRSWFAKAPAEAAAALLQEDQRQPGFAALANTALQTWPEAERSAALAWAAQLPKELDLTEGYGDLAEREGRDNPARGAQWLEKLPSGPARDEAVSRYALEAVRKDGQAAMEWARTIHDPAKRLQTLHRATRTWFSNDAAGAFSWLQNSTEISPAEKAAILKE